MIFKKNLSNGFSLVEVLVAIAILSVVVAGMTSYMTMQQREVKSLTESLAKLDVEKFLIAALADGSACTAELTNSTLNPNAPFKVDTSNATTLAATSFSLNALHSGTTTTSPVLVKKGEAPSPMTNSLVVSDITLSNLEATGVGNQYLAQFTISFNGNLVRQLRPIILKKTISLNGADPANARAITGCLGASSVGLGFPALNSGLMGSYCAPNTYCGRNSGLALCYSKAVTAGPAPFLQDSRVVYGMVGYVGPTGGYIAWGGTPCTSGLTWLN